MTCIPTTIPKKWTTYSNISGGFVFISTSLGTIGSCIPVSRSRTQTIIVKLRTVDLECLILLTEYITLMLKSSDLWLHAGLGMQTGLEISEQPFGFFDLTSAGDGR